MAEITSIKANNGSTIYIEYAEEIADGIRAISVTDDIVERTSRYTETIVTTIQNYADVIMQAVEEGLGKLPPTKIAIEFGIQVGGESGVPFVTKGTVQGNVHIFVEWDLLEQAKLKSSENNSQKEENK